ncbi:group II intron maturase-specific domain-containing protein (plasmid) [Nostoc sp. UHCC 0926]|uniref:group II intron maturase-specific domain-containing protein n=1 Tax=Nostoc sp. UHCC 0926 TaxID=3025190 RepID=UPI002362D205|nr:group II intron maturase-specific domain-containing protein [Nostoc sp. UHCC 0926]WDD30119.1 group II intron maturase-specific domain-containing protein [Nostoc sp. UHCC 0926]
MTFTVAPVLKQPSSNNPQVEQLTVLAEQVLAELKLGKQAAGYKSAQKALKRLIKPSKKSVLNIRSKLRSEWLNCKGKSVDAVIKKLNPIIRGQANYFRVGVASKIFNSLDHWLYEKQKMYAKRTHRNKSDSWRKAKYYRICLTMF